MKVLIAYDGSQFGEDALDDLYRAGLHDVDALVLSVGEMWVPSPEMLQREFTDEIRECLHEHEETTAAQARAVADRARLWLREHFPHWRVAAEGAAGSPVEAILSRAESWDADLVVIGAHGQSAAPRMFPGSVLLGVLRHVPRSARIARKPKFRGNSATRLLVAVDGSRDSQLALAHVRSRVWPAGTEIQVVTVVDTRMMPLVIPGLRVGPTSEDWATKIAAEAVEFLQGGGLKAFSAIERGDPKHVLLEAAQNWAADCVFIGARGLSRLPWLHLGTVATVVAMRAHCSVEVVRQSVKKPILLKETPA